MQDRLRRLILDEIEDLERRLTPGWSVDIEVRFRPGPNELGEPTVVMRQVDGKLVQVAEEWD